MAKGSHKFGTRIAGGLDVQSLRGGLAAPGLDTRYWSSLGTVATVDDEGDVNYDDPHAVVIGPEGVECDVVLHPLDQRVTAIWAGGMAGDCSDISPIHPGDQVVVECPGGDLTTPVITTIIHSRSNKQPMTKGKPIFDNKRRLVYMAKGDLDTRVATGNHSTEVIKGDCTIKADAGKVEIAAGEKSVWVKQDKVQLGSGDATESVVLGNTRKTAEDTYLSNMSSAVTAAITAAGTLLVATSPPPAPATPLTPLGPGFEALVTALTSLEAAITAFSGQTATFLSHDVKTT